MYCYKKIELFLVFLGLMLFIKSGFADVKNGEQLTYYENGGTKEIISYKNGIMDGKYQEYYQNGNIKSEGQYVNDKAEGIWYYYDTEGRRIKDAIYKNDEANGPFNEYYGDGALRATGFYKDGLLTGEYKEFYKNGRDIYFSANYLDGYLVGEYSGFGFYKDGETFVHRAKEDKYFDKNKNYNDYETTVKSKNNEYEKYTGFGGFFTYFFYKYMHFIYSIFCEDYGNSFGILSGSFKGGKFSGTITNNKATIQQLTIKDDIVDGFFQGLLPEHIFKHIKNADILKKYYDEYEFLGRGTIKNNMFIGEIDSVYGIYENGMQILVYNPYLRGYFSEGKYSGYILTGNSEFYTFVNGRLEGTTFKLMQEFIEPSIYEQGIKKTGSHYDCKIYGSDCVYQFLGQNLNTYGPWRRRFESDIKYYSPHTQKMEIYTPDTRIERTPYEYYR